MILFLRRMPGAAVHPPRAAPPQPSLPAGTHRDPAPLAPRRRPRRLRAARDPGARPAAAGRAAPTTHRASDGASADPRALTVDATDTRASVSAARPPPRATLTLQRHEHRQQGQRVLPARRRRPADRRRGREHRPRPDPRPRPAPPPAGDYFTACKPGMVGDGIRATFTVSDSGEDAGRRARTSRQLVAQANTHYAAYVRDQTDQLLAKTEEFADARTRPATTPRPGRSTRRPARTGSASRPVAESFGDLDPKMDLREADLEPGQKWTGWHRIEKDLWPAARQGLHGADRGRADELRRRPAGQHQTRSTTAPGT